MKRMVLAYFAVLVSLTMPAQQYRPEGRAFVCVNGQNRYTRALYGRHGDWRVETSDRPVFTICQKTSRNTGVPSASAPKYVQFRVNDVNLAETDYCESRYVDGMRSYVVRHKTWGAKAVLRLKVAVSQVSEQACWQFQTAGFEDAVRLDVLVGNNDKAPEQKFSQTFEDECYVGSDSIEVYLIEAHEGKERFEEMETAMIQLADRVVFNTPDPYINTLGGALAVAADGDWDGKTWLGNVDGLLWHLQFEADKASMRKIWPALKDSLAWEKRTYDPDGDHLYDAHRRIGPSGPLYYSGGAVTHSSAFNYRANRLAARIAALIGEDAKPYQAEADAILNAMNSRLWLKDKGQWAEYQDLMGLQRLHEAAAVWSIYTPIDCGACSPEQAYWATKYIDNEVLLPGSWSTGNVAAAEGMHTALAYFEAGRAEEGFKLLKANVLDRMYYGQSPANLGQDNRLDATQGDCNPHASDYLGISVRTLLQGLFGIQPDAMSQRCIIRPGFPEAWDSASVRTSYIYYRFQRQGDEGIYEVTQHFQKPQKIVIRQNLGMGKYRDVEGTSEEHQVIRVKMPVPLPEVRWLSAEADRTTHTGYTDEPSFDAKFRKQNITGYLNANVTDIFRNEYLSPRPPYTTLQIPVQGVGDWCHPDYVPDINDSVFRSLIVKDEFVMMGVPFRTPAVGHNIIYTSLWDNYPDSVSIPMSGSASRAWLLMAGSTNHMQRRIVNGMVVAHYKDGSADTLQLVNPDTWCPIERGDNLDDEAFQSTLQRPYRVALASGKVGRNLGVEIPGGAAQMLCMPLDPKKKLLSLTLHTLSNDVVIGLMAVTLQ